MIRSPRLLSLLVISSAFACSAIIAGSSWFRLERGSVRFEPGIYRFDAFLTVGESKYDVPVMLKNETGRSVTILGGPEFCGRTGCINLKGFPLVIPPAGCGRISILFGPGDPGPFDNEITFYTDNPGQPEVVMHVVGTVIDARPLSLSSPPTRNEDGGAKK